ncbi:MAG: hypothetical protein GY868_01165, partial [Deltaproteobacteria bacterium]|nr:hypothetical protein [Deltaproteobacteria bacterium]
ILEYGRFQESGFSGDEIENTFHVRIAVADADDIPDSTNRSPQVEIMAPDNAAVFSGNETIWFQGIAVDPEDGILSNDALQWTSSRDGDFGSGNQPGSDNLTIGMHTITLQAVDTEGTVGTDSIIIAIDAADAETQL